MNKHLPVLIVLLGFGLVGCSTAGFIRNLDSWVGSNIEEYFQINSLTPKSVVKLNNGSSIYSFFWSSLCYWNITTNQEDIIINTVMDSNCGNTEFVKMNPKFKPNE